LTVILQLAKLPDLSEMHIRVTNNIRTSSIRIFDDRESSLLNITRGIENSPKSGNFSFNQGGECTKIDHMEHMDILQLQ